MRTGTSRKPARWAARKPAFTGDQFVAILALADDERLEHAVVLDALGQVREFVVVEEFSRLMRIGFHMVDRDLHGDRRGAGEECIEFAIELSLRVHRFTFRSRPPP